MEPIREHVQDIIELARNPNGDPALLDSLPRCFQPWGGLIWDAYDRVACIAHSDENFWNVYTRFLEPYGPITVGCGNPIAAVHAWCLDRVTLNPNLGLHHICRSLGWQLSIQTLEFRKYTLMYQVTLFRTG
jgi:hypothetical protein